MDYRRFGAKLLVRLDKGEDIVESVKRLCREADIRLAVVSGIGALDYVSVGLFEQGTKQYHTKEFSGSMEITGLAGNATRMKGEVYLHLHIVLTDASYAAFGGHLNKGRVGATAELVLEILDGEAEREYDEVTGLNLIGFAGDE